MSRSSYYRHRRKQQRITNQVEQVLVLVQRVRSILPRVGVRKLYHMLQAELKALQVGRDKLFKILKANNLLINPRRCYRQTTQSKHRFRKHKNLITTLEIDRPEQVWVSDITYLGGRKDPMYLALVTDAYSKRIMGYQVSKTLEAKHAGKALRMAIKNRRYPNEELIHHSDRGIQYCCDSYQSVLAQGSIRCSMTESYDPYQNAVAERINGILKQEFIQDIRVDQISIMQELIKDSIEKYNQYRPHYSNRYLTPNQMHRKQVIKRRTFRSEKNTESSP